MKKSTSIPISYDIYRNVKKMAYEKNTTIKNITDQALTNYIDKVFLKYEVAMYKNYPAVIIHDVNNNFKHKYVAVFFRNKDNEVKRKFIDKEINVDSAYNSLFNIKLYSIIEIQYSNDGQSKLRDYYSLTKKNLVYLCDHEKFNALKHYFYQYVQGDLKHNELINKIASTRLKSIDEIYNDERNFTYD